MAYRLHNRYIDCARRIFRYIRKETRHEVDMMELLVVGKMLKTEFEEEDIRSWPSYMDCE